jgi:hypothetical protein
MLSAILTLKLRSKPEISLSFLELINSIKELTWSDPSPAVLTTFLSIGLLIRLHIIPGLQNQAAGWVFAIFSFFLF